MARKSVVLTLIGINIAVFVLQMLFDNYGLTGLLAVREGDMFSRPWTILTSIFAHSGFSHILFNMYVLLIFGPLLEQRIGQKRFLTIYFASGLLASAISSFIYPAALGASGAIMGMMGVIIVLMPYLRILFFFVIPMPLWIAGIVIALIDLAGVFYPGSGIANAAHLTGMAIGLGYGFYLKKKGRGFKRRFSRTGHLSEGDVDDFLRHGRI